MRTEPQPVFVRIAARRLIRRVEREQARSGEREIDESELPGIAFPAPGTPASHPALGLAHDAARSGGRVLLVSHDGDPEEMLDRLVRRLSGATLLGQPAISDIVWSAAIGVLAELARLDLWFAKVDAPTGGAVGSAVEAWRRTLEGRRAGPEVLVILSPVHPERAP